MTAPQDDDLQDDNFGGQLSHNKADDLSPGEILREARLAHDYTINDLCAQTKLSPKIVSALEENDFQALSQPVFARGYYRQCAKVLDIDNERMMRAYTAWAGEPAQPRPATPSRVNVITQDVTPDGSRIGRLLVLVVVVVAAILVAWYLVPAENATGGAGADNTTSVAIGNGNTASDNASADTGNDNGGDTNSSGTDVASGGTPAVVGDNGGQPPRGANVNRSLGIQPPTGAHQPAGAGPATASASASSVPPNQLVLTFTKRSWVRVTDANGNRLASGIFNAGQTKQFNAKAPYQVRLGFAPGVKVSIGGQPVDVAAKTNGSSVATLTVDAPTSGGSAAGNDNGNG